MIKKKTAKLRCYINKGVMSKKSGSFSRVLLFVRLTSHVGLKGRKTYQKYDILIKNNYTFNMKAKQDSKVQSTPESKIPPHGSFALYILNAAS
jgi:hypothetical protein